MSSPKAAEEFARLTGLIDSLLFLARAESPQTQIARQAVDIGHELAAIREFCEAAAAEAGVTLQVHCAEALHTDADRTLLQRAIANLVANAIAHTGPGGTITLGAGQDDPYVYIEVADSGSGIAAEHLPHVFDRFYRADPARTNSSGRIGLGLAIVKSIAGLHGGSVSITSEVGKGTCVRVFLPGKTALDLL